jgi:hypothetical protein
MSTTAQATEYEIDRVNRNRQARAEAARLERQQIFCKDREEAIQLDSRASQLQSRIAAFDDPQGDLRDQVQSARKWRRWGLFTLFAVALIANADFWLAMPDVSENLANKATSLITRMQGKDGRENAEESATASTTLSNNNRAEGKIGVENTEARGTDSLATPVPLRIGIGITIVCIWLSLTLGWKACTDTTELRNSAVTLVPGDDEGNRKIQHSIWLRRAGRVAYMAILAGLFCYLYTFDLQRARAIVEGGQMENSDASMTNWPDFGLGISNGELETNEATPKSSDPVQQAVPVDPEQAAHNLARPQVLVYTLLGMLHCLLLVIPAGQRPDDVTLARFDRGKAERSASELRQGEESILRGMYTRIYQAPPEEKDALVVEAMPVAKRINATLGWLAIEEPAGLVSGDATSRIPIVNEPPAVATYDAPTEGTHAEKATNTPPNAGARREPGSGIQPNEPEDPYQAIFG